MASSSSASGVGYGQLLDSSLDDFTSLDLPANPQSGGEASSSASAERKPLHGLGLGMGLPDPRAPRRRPGKEPASPARGSSTLEALEQLTGETREALRGLETARSSAAAGSSGSGGELVDDAMVEEFVKQFEDLAGSEDMESFVLTMMQQLMPKDILHEPMMEIIERYPKWLEENKDKLSKEKYERYAKQLELMVKLNEVYESDPENLSNIAHIMQKMQEYGQPPSDIVKEFLPGVDLSSFAQMSERLEWALNCCIM